MLKTVFPSITHAELLSLWPPERERILAKRLNVTRSAVRRWRERNSIPSRYWPGIIAEAKRDYDRIVTPADLMWGAAALNRPKRSK